MVAPCPLASLIVLQRQLNQNGSHRPNLRKILYVIVVQAFPSAGLQRIRFMVTATC